ncbi:MAG: cysteine synthase A [Firmicutes bacterium]|nr:cysteine synthase A [Bacillota bacterium]
MKVYNSVTELVGNTPLVKLNRVTAEQNLTFNLYGKLESMNPAGSAKDRVGLAMIADAEKRGILKPGATIIEPTSGNTGIGLAAAASSRGYRTILTMPDTMSIERRNLLKAYGAQVVLTPGAEGMKGAIAKAEELAAEIPGSFIPGQFENPANPRVHYETTGPELWRDLDGQIDVFVAGVGTGGTISGAGRYLKEKNPDVKIIAVEPAGSPLLSQGKAGPHGLQGIGANFVPTNLDRTVIDEIITITEEEAYQAGRLMAACEGTLVGITAGAALHAAMKVGMRPENTGKNVVAFLPDTGDRYLSTPLFAGQQE